jgi:demethylmenaquinone methyltransferase / 2-methoxy-6-polyprenyl-1,4-benzoquinol methylase
MTRKVLSVVSDGNPANPRDVRAMFERLAPAYDAMNVVISGFQEPRWRRRTVTEAGLGPGMRALDVACGTGRVTADLARAVAPSGEAVGLDFSPRMIASATRRHGGLANVTFVVGDALALPFPDASFDAATIAFGMRNLADYGHGFAELRRVVRPGGRVVCLETARPQSALGRPAAVWFDHFVPMLGWIVGHGEAYAYLVGSARDYPSPERIAEIMTGVGLADVRWFSLFPGIVSIHVGIAGATAVPTTGPVWPG